MSIYWFLLTIILIFIELITVNLVTIWFAFGSVAAMVTGSFTESLIIQVIVFIVVSLISLLVTKPLIRKFKMTKIEPTNVDRVVGKVGVVTKKISKMKYGEVKVLGSIWTAVSEEAIEEDTKVIVKKIDGVKLIVEKEEK